MKKRFETIETVYDYNTEEEMNKHLWEHQDWHVMEKFQNDQENCWTAIVRKRIKGVPAGF